MRSEHWEDGGILRYIVRIMRENVELRAMSTLQGEAESCWVKVAGGWMTILNSSSQTCGELERDQMGA
jgi:hypothetical protein